MADQLTLTELGFRIALLPPLARGAAGDGPPVFSRALAGPWLHARRLIELWKVVDGDDTSLTQAFRFLDQEAVAGAISKTLTAKDCPVSDPRYWNFPALDDLLPELQELSWQAMLAGALWVEGIKGVRGKRHRAVLPAELPRLRPDWELSRLVLGTSDKFIDVRARRPPAEPVRKTWKDKPTQAKVDAAMEEIAKGYPPDVHPSEQEIWNKLKAKLEATRQQARNAIKKHPRLRGQRGYSSTKSPS
jgi:hypothetical protein